MTSEELKTLIESDATATASANLEDWVAVASRASSIAPALLRETPLSELSILRLSSDPVAAETVLQQIEQVAQQNPVVARVLKWMKPESQRGLDFGDPRVRGMLTTPINQGGCGLSEEQARPLLAAAEYQPEISPLECRIAMRGA